MKTVGFTIEILVIVFTLFANFKLAVFIGVLTSTFQNTKFT